MTQAPAAGAQTSNLQRTAVLLSFSALVVASQVLWLSFASITDKTADKLGVSEGAVGDLAVINAAMFVVLAIPAGRWMDRHYGRTLAAGALFTAVGALIRFADPGSYAVICAGQVVMSIGQPLILNGLTKIAARYYPQEKRTTAISIGSASQFVGILIAVLTGAPLFDAGKLPLVLGVDAAIAVVAAVAVLVSLRVPPAYEVEVPEAAGSAVGPIVCGLLADKYGLMSTFYFMAATIVVANMFVFTIPRDLKAAAS